ncbi:haloacid dehalogenase-like hydrolase [Clostridium sp. Cult2]|uniref:haloacid dehalogenase-like hydrolase n=1 Tax=Clostridium sp. Cult2 TaxID=2079003 RepID=UPI001F3B97E5
MEQNVIAVIWDFDKTLIKGYMQRPIFEKYDVDERLFWDEVNRLHDEYETQGIKVNKETIYLNHFITCANQGIFKDLNNSLLRELGQELEFYNGIPEIFVDLKNIVEKDERYRKHSITLEHYIVSTGLSELIKGSKISEYVDGIWGCEFIEVPIKSNIEIKEYRKNEVEDNGIISQVGYAIDNTTKTRAIFEINKGVNKFREIDVNSKLPYNMRRVPIENMIYIADGPSDVPVFSVLKQNGGTTFAVYAEDSQEEFHQVERLRTDGRVDMYGPANYSRGTLTYMWLNKQVRNIAERIYFRLEHKVLSSVSKPPEHITD